MKCIYIKELELCLCTKYESKRKIGIKVEKWFIDVCEAYYVMNYKELSYEIVDTLKEALENRIDANKSDHIEFLNTVQVNVNKLCAYIQLRNMGYFLRKVLTQNQIDIIQSYYIDMKYDPQLGDYIIYQNFEKYRLFNGKTLYLYSFSNNVGKLPDDCWVGLIENAEVKLIQIN